MSVKAGTYALSELLAKMSKAGKANISAQPGSADTRLAVVAANTPIRILLWSIEVATGLEVRVVEGSRPPTIVVSSDTSRKPDAQINLLVPIKGLGYFPPLDSPTARELLQWHSAETPESGKYSMGWRLSDLPLLYRSYIDDKAQQRTHKFLPHPLEPEDTFVLWIRVVYISFGLNFEDGSGGGGPEILLPAL